MRLTEQQIIEGLTKRGVPAHTAKGVAMNFQDESGFETGIQEHNPTAGRGGFGLAQWTGPRRVNLENYAAAQGKAVDDADTQLDFFMQENAGPEAKAWSTVLNATNHREAAAAFVNNWERPAAEHAASRTAKYMSGSPDAATAYSLGTEVPVSPTMSIQGVERPDEVEAPSFAEQYEASFGLNTTARVYDYAADFINDQQTFRKDPEWIKNGPSEEQQLEDLASRKLDPEVYANYIGGSTSAAGYNRQLQNAVEDNDRRALLARGGLTGSILEFVNTTIGDPLQMGVDVAVTAVAPQFTIAKYGVRVGGVLSKAMAGGLAGAATSTLGYTLDPNGHAGDIVFGIGMGMGVGSLVGAMGSKIATGPESQALQRIAQRTTAEYEGVPYVARGSTVGAASSPTRDFIDPDSALAGLKVGDTPDSAFRGGRFDLSARFNKSGNALTKGMGHALVSEGAGMVEKVSDGSGKVVARVASVNGRAASEEAEHFKLEMRTGYMRTYKAQLDEWHKLEGTNPRDRLLQGRSENKFNDQIDTYMRDRKSDRTSRYPKPVQAAGDKLAKQYAELNKLQANPWSREGKQGRAVLGHDDIPDDVHYAPRELKAEKIVAISHDLEEGTVERLIFGAARSANPDIPEEALNRFAKGYTKAIIDRANGLGDDTLELLGRDNMDEMRKVFDNLEGLSSEHKQALDNMMGRFTDKKGASDAGHDTHQRHRSVFDESYELPQGSVRTKYGAVDEQGLSIRDLINTNATQLFNRYTTRASGNIALARVRLVDGHGNMAVDGITSQGEWNKFIEDTRKWGAQNKVPKEKTDADVEGLNFAYDSIRGRQVDRLENTDAGFLLRNIRKYNFMRIMNQSGFAALPELGHVVAQAGVKASLSQMPGFWRVIKNAGLKGVNSAGDRVHLDQFTDDFEATFGSGAERLNRFSTSDAMDALSATMDDTNVSGWRAKVDNVTERGTYVTADMSGLAGINQISQRWAGRAIIQNFANMAAGRTKMMSTKRLRDLGLADDMAVRVMAELRLGRILKMDGKKVAGLDFDKAVDKEALQAFKFAVHRKVDQIIQKSDIGNLMPFMSGAVGKMIMQFRSFMAGALVRQTFKSMHMRDPATLMTLVLGSTISAGGYTLRSYAQTAGMSPEERHEYLHGKNGRLRTAAIGAAAFSGIGASSILPLLYDSTIGAATGNPAFGQSRTTGQASDIFANPTIGLLNDVQKGVRGGLGMLDGNFGKSEEKAVAKLLPFANALPFLTFNNALINDLPEGRDSNDWLAN